MPAKDRISSKRHRQDRLTSVLVHSGGALVLMSLLVLIWHLVSQTLPLLYSPAIQPQSQWQLPADMKVQALDNPAEARMVIARGKDCALHYLQLDSSQNKLTAQRRRPFTCDQQLKIVNFEGQDYLFSLGAGGILRSEVLSQMQARIEHQDSFALAVSDVDKWQGLKQWQVAMARQWVGVAAELGDGWHVYWVNTANRADIRHQFLGAADKLLLFPRVQQVVALQSENVSVIGTKAKLVQQWPLAEAISFASVAPGQEALYLASSNALQKWSIFNANGEFHFQQVWSLGTHKHAAFRVQALLFHASTNAGLMLTDEQALFFNTVTGEVVSTQAVSDVLPEVDGGIELARLDGHQLILAGAHKLELAQVKHISGINTWASLWDKAWFEGYAKPGYVWQTTSAADYQQAKFSVAPLLMGSIKVALMALTVAIPMALGAAIFTAYFADASLRRWLKPAIEMLEAIPSVIIGFIAAIWLTPLAEEGLVAIALLIWYIPLFFVLAAVVKRLGVLPKAFVTGPGFGLALGVLIAAGLAATLSFQSAHEWAMPYLSNVWQRFPSAQSTLVVVFALGIAITPSIYSLAEDAIYEVPQHLKQASFALGATAMQTLKNVVLVVAYPGILSAVTLGFGRAFGETMIVLMVTGNTAVADWNPLSGLRALTANLAIELPESEVGSSHYQILFLTALLLFLFTFVVNTLAEALRGHLRKRAKHG